MNSQNNMIEGSCNFLSGSSLHITTLPSLAAIYLVNMFVVCHEIY